MLEPTHILDERNTTDAIGTDFWSVLTDEMLGLYQLAFALTADLGKADQCFVSGMGECEEEIGVFMARTQAQARRMIIERAVRMIMPAPERPDDFTVAHRNGWVTSGGSNLLDAIVRLNAFERFVYVMSVLEKRSDGDCSALLRCSRRDVIMARALALEQLSNTYSTYDPPLEAVGTWRTMFPNHCAC
jgi:hypothetical protein